VAADGWSGVRDAGVEGSECVQYDGSNPPGPGVLGDEDCLFINVYIPELPDSSNDTKAVMVWIYGGGFQGGSSNETLYGSGKLMGYDVISVTFNYRVGSLGFLSTGDDVIPGNYGLWDQILALQWVQENIAAFGGDPDRVTIYGQSAGGFSTSSLFLSPQANGLFQAVIAESGAMLLQWTYQPKPLQYAQLLAESTNCPSDNSSLMLSCLQNKTVEELYTAQLQFDYAPDMEPFLFGPVLDRAVSDGILPDTPMNLISNELYNKVPFLSGTTEEEGVAFYQLTLAEGVIMDANFLVTNLGKLIQNYTYLHGDELAQVNQLVYDEYFLYIDKLNNTAIGEGVSQFISDALFNVNLVQMVNLLPKGEGYPALYTYVFSYMGEYSNDVLYGVSTHADEIPYIFGDGILNAQDNVTSERILTLWTTFAKTGNPNTNSSDVVSVTWEAVTSSDSIPYLNIDTELSMQEDFRQDRMQFWNDEVLPIVFAYDATTVNPSSK
jgi:carboxylesterase type B